MTNSGSSALDAACALAGLTAGDEVILPSFTFPSAASAVLKSGAVPVFVDIEPEHLTIDCDEVDVAITSRTRAIIAVDYAGMACDYDRLSDLAHRHDLALIEDAAHAFDARFQDRALGTFGTLGIVSFQQTKNVSCGEGGALLINDPALVNRAEHLRDKGTNRQEMERRLVPFYEWVEIGGGIGLNELSAAVLRAQFEEAAAIRHARRRAFDIYHERLSHLDKAGVISLVKPAAEHDHNAHLLAFLARDGTARDRILSHLNGQNIGAAFHYVPLHASKAGRAFGRTPRGCPVTEEVAGRIVRLPLFVDLSEDQIGLICTELAGAAQARPRER